MCAIASSTTSCMARGSPPARGRSATAPMCAPSSSASGRNSAMLTRNSRRSKITPDSATAGAKEMAHSLPGKIYAGFRTLALKIMLLAVIFLFVPIIFYRLFQVADAQQSALLQRTVEEKGALIASVLAPRLAAFQSEPQEKLQQALDEILSQGTNIKVLVRPV